VDCRAHHFSANDPTSPAQSERTPVMRSLSTGDRPMSAPVCGKSGRAAAGRPIGGSPRWLV
jgi:hypothetical protein